MDRDSDRSAIFRQRQGGDSLEYGNVPRGFWLRRCLVCQMAIRTSRIVRSIVTIPVADNNRGEDKQRKRCERNRQSTNDLSRIHPWEPMPDDIILKIQTLHGIHVNRLFVANLQGTKAHTTLLFKSLRSSVAANSVKVSVDGLRVQQFDIGTHHLSRMPAQRGNDLVGTEFGARGEANACAPIIA
jgi:hypothetical protein